MLKELDRFHQLDRTILGSSDAYIEYFNYIRSAFELVIREYKIDSDGNQDEIALLQYFFQKFLNSVECLRMKYLFSNEFKMKIDQSDSSFPHNIEFMNLQDDMNRRDDKLAALPSHQALIKDLVEWIYVRQEQPVEIQQKIASRFFYELLKSPESVYLTYSPGELRKFSSEDTRKRPSFVYTWSMYEPSFNVPLLYQMIFEVESNRSSGKNFSTNITSELHDILKHVTRTNNPLADIAGSIDTMCVEIFPKEIKRLTIGPLYGKYSLHESPISNIVNSCKSDDAFALVIRREVVRSNSERKGKLLSNKSFYQNFVVSHISTETLNQKVTDSCDYLFAPHHVAQKILNSKEGASMVKKIKIISLTKNNESNGDIQ